MLARNADDIIEVRQREVGRDLEQHWRRACTRTDTLACVDDAREQIVERLGLLQIPKAGRIRRRYIDGEIAGDRGERFDQPHIVLGPVDGVAIGANVDAHNATGVPAGREPYVSGGGPVVIEAQPVDDALVGVKAEQTRSWITALDTGRDG